MIHVVFNEQDAEAISKALELDETMAGKVMVVRDDYAVGPLDNLSTPEGAVTRKEWWQHVLTGGDQHAISEEGKVNDEQVVRDISALLEQDQDELIWIWAAQNKHDVCGYYWLVSQLAAFQGRIFILYLNNLPFISDKGTIFYPDWLSQIPSKEFLKAKKLARPVTPSEFEIDSDEWNKICAEGSMVRLLDGGKKIIHQAVDFYDVDLVRYISGDKQKASKIINAFLSKNKEITGDAFLLWRLKHIATTGNYEVLGELKGIKDFEISKRSSTEAAD